MIVLRHRQADFIFAIVAVGAAIATSCGAHNALGLLNASDATREGGSAWSGASCETLLHMPSNSECAFVHNIRKPPFPSEAIFWNERAPRVHGRRKTPKTAAGFARAGFFVSLE